MNENKYYLMHKDIVVAEMLISDDGNVSNLKKNQVYADHFPVGGQMNEMKFYEWWKDRAIPKTRDGAKSALQRLGYSSTGSALVNNLALSLNDCYWIKPFTSDLNWKDVNLFENDFVDSFGSLTFNINSKHDFRNITKFHFATSQGELKKKWCIDDEGKRFLLKGNYGDSYQQSLNELFACNIYKQLGFNNYLNYEIANLKTIANTNGIGCFSYNFCNNNVESISVWEYLQTRKIKKNESLYHPLKDICLSLGMKEKDFDYFIDWEIMIDFLITNTDRHMNNISILRDPDTLKTIGFAPVYDNGNSMFYNVPYENLFNMKFSKIETHSFIKHELKLLSYVHNRNCIDFEKLKPDFSIYNKEVFERKIRIKQLESLFNKKLLLLKDFQNDKDIWSYSYIKNHLSE